MSNDSDNEVKIYDDEKAVLLDHDYDGIRELNHPLPAWWVVVFIGTVVFSIPYFLYYSNFGGPSSDEELAADMAIIYQNQANAVVKKVSFNMDEYNSYIATAKAKKSGKKIYKRKCKACHGANGEGGIGPNLTDKFWINGDGSIPTIYKVVDEGVVDKGMAAWGDSLGKNKVMAVVDYINSFKGTNPENAKGPQGQKYE